MEKSLVPESLLQRLAKLSPGISVATRDLRAASEERDIRAAEKTLSTWFLLTPGAAKAAGMTQGESTAMTTLVHGRGYEEPKG
jgi:hypothetical protein